MHLRHLAQGIFKDNAEEQAAPLRPKKDVRNGLERLRHTSFKLNPQNLPGKIEMRRPRPHNWETDLLKRLGQVQHQRDRSMVHCSCFEVKPFHLAHGFPNGTLRSSTASTSHIPNNSMPFLLPLHLRLTQFLTFSHQSGQKSNEWGVRLWHFGIRKNMVAHACCGHVPHCSTFSKCSTSTPRFLRQVEKNLRVEPVTAHIRCGLVTPRSTLEAFFLQLR